MGGSRFSQIENLSCNIKTTLISFNINKIQVILLLILILYDDDYYHKISNLSCSKIP